MPIAHVPVTLWCHSYNYRSFVCWFNYYFVSINFSSSDSKTFLKFIQLIFDLRILVGMCSICLHMFSNSWCSFGGGVNDKGIFAKETSWKFEFLKGYAKPSFCENCYKSYSRSGIFCGGVRVKDSPSFRSLISSLLSVTLPLLKSVARLFFKSFFFCIYC